MIPNNVLWNIIRGPKGEDRLMPKLRHINKEKDFLEWARKRRNLKNQLAEKPAFPRCLACVGLCEVFATKALIPYQPPLGRFCGAFGKAGFFLAGVGHPGK